jgi:outer membrane protein assembly factor BamE (lipoprotein component of BamABCDE complex)
MARDGHAPTMPLAASFCNSCKKWQNQTSKNKSIKQGKALKQKQIMRKVKHKPPLAGPPPSFEPSPC